MIPDIYAKLASDEKTRRGEASAAPYFLACIESRVIEALSEYCTRVCREYEGVRELRNLSLQFDSAEILIGPHPDDFKSSDERHIEEKTGLRANLVEKKHEFFLEKIMSDPTSVDRLANHPTDSILYDSGRG